MTTKGAKRVLITGGAGFIGSHTTDLLIKRGYQVDILDNLEPQVHGENEKYPEYLNPDASFIHGDIRDRDLLTKVIPQVDAIIHLASMTGVIQSMYKIKQYVDVNTNGTANLLDVLANEEHSVKKLIVASSNTVYGEGKYFCEMCSIEVYPSLRSETQMKKKQWMHLCPNCGSPLISQPTDENKPLIPTAIYAMTKRHQEEMSLLIGKTYGIPTVALRYFNVYGSRQALENPYTGVFSRFITRIRNDKSPLIYEDGCQTRDFIHVKDIVNANLLTLEKAEANYKVLNVGTGTATTIYQIANSLIELCRIKMEPEITMKHRAGDVRHCYADITQIQKIGFQPEVELSEGLKETLNWACKQKTVLDKTDKASKELNEHGLIR